MRNIGILYSSVLLSDSWAFPLGLLSAFSSEAFYILLSCSTSYFPHICFSSIFSSGAADFFLSFLTLSQYFLFSSRFLALAATISSSLYRDFCFTVFTGGSLFCLNRFIDAYLQLFYFCVKYVSFTIDLFMQVLI